MAYNTIRVATGLTPNIDPYSGQSAADAFYIYVCGRDYVAKINRSSGIITHIRRTYSFFACNPVWYGGHLYCATTDNKIIILDTDDLSILDVKYYSSLLLSTYITQMRIVGENIWINCQPFTYIIRISDMSMTNKLLWTLAPPPSNDYIINGDSAYTYKNNQIFRFNPVSGEVEGRKQLQIDGESLTTNGANITLLNEHLYIAYSLPDNTYNFGLVSIPLDLSTISASIRMVADTEDKHFSYPNMSYNNTLVRPLTNDTSLYIYSCPTLKASPYTTTNPMLCCLAQDTAVGFADPVFTEQWIGCNHALPRFTFYGATTFGFGGLSDYLYDESSSYTFFTLNTLNTPYDGFSSSPLALQQLSISENDEFTIHKDDNLSLVDVDWDNTITSYSVGTSSSSTVTMSDASFVLYSENIKRFGIDTISGIGYTTDGVLRAAMTGKVYGDGTAADCSFEWGKTDSYGNETTTQSISGTASGVTYGYGISNNTLPSDEQLKPSTTYHFRAKGIHPTEGTLYGEDATFYTPGAIMPTATISRVGSIKHVYDRTQAGIPPKFYMEVNLGGLAPEYMDAFTDQPITYVINRPPAGGAINGGRPDPVYPPDDSYNDYPPDYDPPWPDTSRPRNGGR